MKANSEKAFREKNWRTIFETMEDNLLTVLDVLHEEYGFGEKRLMQFLLSVQNKAAELQNSLQTARAWAMSKDGAGHGQESKI